MTISPDSARAAFIAGNTLLTVPPLIPEFRLHLATEITPLGQATEATLETTGLPPPYNPVVTMLRRIHAVVAGGSDGSSEYEGADEP